MSEDQGNEPEVVVSNEALPVEESTTEVATEEAPQLNGYEKRISKLTARNYHDKDVIAQQKAEIETLKAAGVVKLDISTPELPSDDLRYDKPDEYKKQSEAYHSAIAVKAVADAEKARDLRNQEAAKQEQASQLQQRHNTIVEKYVDGGIKSGISEVKMQANEAVLASSNLSRDIVEFMYDDDHGAKLIDFLADNPEKMAQLAAVSPMQASILIANEFKPQALSTKPTHTTAPDPIEPTRGAGSAPTEGLSPLLAGATFE